MQKRSKKERYLYHQDSSPSSVNYGAPPTMMYGGGSHHNHSGHQQTGNASDTLGKLYESGITGRYGQQF